MLCWRATGIRKRFAAARPVDGGSGFSRCLDRALDGCAVSRKEVLAVASGRSMSAVASLFVDLLATEDALAGGNGAAGRAAYEALKRKSARLAGRGRLDGWIDARYGEALHRMVSTGEYYRSVSDSRRRG